MVYRPQMGVLLESVMNEDLNRRSFLKAAGVSGAAVVMCPTLAAGSGRAEPGGKWRMRLSTSSIHFMGLPIEKACERIAGLGFEAVDIWSAHQGCPHLDDVGKRLGPEGFKELLARNKLKLFAFSVYKGGYERYARLLGKAGGGVAVRGSSAPCKPDELTLRMRQFIESLQPLVELAEEHESYLAIENHGNALLCSQDSFKAFVDNNTSPRLGIALAPYHVQAQKASVPEAIRICGRQLLFFYAWQNSPGNEQLPGVGPTDMTPWIRALADIGYRGYVNPFMHGDTEPDLMAANLARSRDYLGECHKKACTAA